MRWASTYKIASTPIKRLKNNPSVVMALSSIDIMAFISAWIALICKLPAPVLLAKGENGGPLSCS